MNWDAFSHLKQLIYQHSNPPSDSSSFRGSEKILPVISSYGHIWSGNTKIGPYAGLVTLRGGSDCKKGENGEKRGFWGVTAPLDPPYGILRAIWRIMPFSM